MPESAATGFAPSTVATPVSTTKRLMSVDALRGFDMFWIVGAEELVAALREMTKAKPVEILSHQLDHAEWEGFHFEDLIFPMFVFLMGISVVFSLTKLMQQAGRGEAVKRVIQRGVLLYLVGLIYSGGFSHHWPDIRLLGVLNRIALCYLFGGLIFCYFKTRGMIVISVVFLLGYWALLAWVPFPDVRPVPGGTQVIIKDNYTNISQLNMNSTTMIHGSYIQGVTLPNYLDQKYLPGKNWDGTYDPEGYLSTIPAIVTCLLGIFAGLLLKNPIVPDGKKAIYLISFGVAGVVLGFLWGTQFPVIKKIWTSSYVLVAGGYSAIFMGVFFWIVDIMKFQWWCQPFVWMGMNSITIYLLHGVAEDFFMKLSGRFVGGDVQDFFNGHLYGLGDFFVALVAIFLSFALLRFLYKRKIFLRF